MIELERELTFLVEKLPEDLLKFPSKIVADNYFPRDAKHPILRLRQNGAKYEITKKQPADSTDGGKTGDSSRQIEQTIPLTRAEYDFLNQLDGKRLIKRRFFYKIGDLTAEIGVHLGDLTGLVLADFEFDSEAAMRDFVKPDWCGADVSQEIITAGGILAGKTLDDILPTLSEKYGYKPAKIPTEIIKIEAIK
jgi:CYTH domain-containing protein